MDRRKDEQAAPQREGLQREGLPREGDDGADVADVQMTVARRAPVQGRSQETVQKIFSAASRLLSDGVPPEDMTTVIIAREAGVSVGGLYRFFPDKQAIVDALAAHYMEEFQSVLATDMMTAPLGDGPAFLSAIIDSFAAFLAERPDFRAIALGGRNISHQMREHLSGPDAAGGAMLKQFLVQALGMEPSPDLDLRIRVAAEVGGGLFALAFDQEDPTDRDRYIAEMKRLIAGYLFGR